MKISIAYVSPSTLPSTSANSVHVVLQAAALLSKDVNLFLFAHSGLCSEANLTESILKAYGVDLRKATFVTFNSTSKKLLNLRIAVSALFSLLTKELPQKVLSRNLYFSFFYAVVLRRSLIFETHQVEQGFRKVLQIMTMTKPWVKTIVISKKLEEILTVEQGVAPYNVTILPDAAPDGLLPAINKNRMDKLNQIASIPKRKWNSVCGYIGQLYEGRGIEIIESMAQERPDTFFLVYGGEPQDVAHRREVNAHLPNIFFGGFISHPEAQNVMRCVDFLLMPYQTKVSIGSKGHDTGRWMSPMKMFEYMAAGVPIISSDLPVLREILRNEENALLVSPSKHKEWCMALDRLSNDPVLAESIGKCAYSDYIEKYTWERRAEAILSLFD